MLSDCSKLSIRPCELPRDATGLQMLDSAYESRGRFEIATEGETLILRPRLLDTVKTKRFPIEVEQPRWTNGWVAESSGRIVGFIATELQEWNRRLATWHFYVDRTARRRGIGRELMDIALADGRECGALTAWAETSNENLEGIATYQKLGYRLCGFDQSLYIGTPAQGEFAVYLSRPITR